MFVVELTPAKLDFSQFSFLGNQNFLRPVAKTVCWETEIKYCFTLDVCLLWMNFTQKLVDRKTLFVRDKHTVVKLHTLVACWDSQFTQALKPSEIAETPQILSAPFILVRNAL